MYVIRQCIIAFIYLYQSIISPLYPRNCRYYPSCSQYVYIAFNNCNIIFASFLALKRILKCNAFFKGGVDRFPYENKKNKINESKLKL